MTKIKRNEEFAKWWQHWITQIQRSRSSWVDAPSETKDADKQKGPAEPTARLKFGLRRLREG